MYAYEVRNIKWENFPKERIAKILPTFKSSMSGLCVCQEDVMRFVKNTFDELDEMVAASRSIVYILEEENVKFFEDIHELFSHQQAFRKNEKEFVKVMTSLRLPVVHDVMDQRNLQRAVKLYEQLTEDEKNKFLEAVGARPE